MPRYRHPPRKAAAPAASPQVASPEAASDPILISDLSSEFGVTARALRFYEENGLLRPRRKGNIRLYSPRDREKVRLILLLRSAGFGVNEIVAHIVEGPGRDDPVRIALGVAQIQAKLEENRALLQTTHEAVTLLETWLAALERGEHIV
ncbi:MerR family transcriptional regulator [Phreatobacter sp.]|uniref:MerR family transcriptional regulator n=1 Tax=Phreatobacter sp. TaxID=1966341 RepID=UPI0022C66155|nr:MerR family transcriptional regulator [Phreatobacter sp.]MCZ8317057.1 MerR family transcriptional regulator [Phreatobacter sp.]